MLTGEMVILRADILYDGGIPLNPEVDLGQVCDPRFTPTFALTSEVLFKKEENTENLYSGREMAG